MSLHLVSTVLESFDYRDRTRHECAVEELERRLAKEGYITLSSVHMHFFDRQVTILLCKKKKKDD